jgi:integrase
VSTATKAKKRRAAYGSGSTRKEKQASGKVVWIGQVYVAGRQRQRTLGPASGPEALSTRQARRALEAVRAELEAAEAQRAATDRTSTLRTVAEEHHRHLEGEIRESTLADYRGYLNRHLLPFFGDVPLDSIRVRDVEDFSRHQRTEVKQHRLNSDGSPKVGLAGSTIANHVNYLHSIFEFALRREIITTNPVSPAKKPKIKKQDQDFSFLTVDQVDAVIEAVANDYLGSTDRALVLTAAHTGLRQGELIALRWEDLLWDQAAVRVRASVSRGSLGDPKSVTSRRDVPMSRRVAEVLREHRAASHYATDRDFVFPHPLTGNPYDPNKIRERFYAAMVTAGFSHMIGQGGGGIVFHSLRHTFGTQMASAGAPLVAIKEWMGHADIQTTMIYAKWAKDREAERALVEAAFLSPENR